MFRQNFMLRCNLFMRQDSATLAQLRTRRSPGRSHHKHSLICQQVFESTRAPSLCFRVRRPLRCDERKIRFAFQRSALVPLGPSSRVFKGGFSHSRSSSAPAPQPRSPRRPPLFLSLAHSTALPIALPHARCKPCCSTQVSVDTLNPRSSRALVQTQTRPSTVQDTGGDIHSMLAR